MKCLSITSDVLGLLDSGRYDFIGPLEVLFAHDLVELSAGSSDYSARLWAGGSPKLEWHRSGVRYRHRLTIPTLDHQPTPRVFSVFRFVSPGISSAQRAVCSTASSIHAGAVPAGGCLMRRGCQALGRWGQLHPQQLLLRDERSRQRGVVRLPRILDELCVNLCALGLSQRIRACMRSAARL